MQPCCIPLRDLRYLRENIHIRVLNLSAKKKTHVSPADLADDADKPQNNNNQTVFLCEIMRLCCIRLRHLRYLRENIHMRVLNQTTQKKPQCLSQITQIIADEPQNNNNHPNGLSLRNNAACCIPLRYLRYLRENNTQEYSIYRHKETPMSPADLADLRRRTTKQQNP